MERKYENVYLVTSPDIQVQNLLETMSDLMAVSYTHLTLPTICSV